MHCHTITTGILPVFLAGIAMIMIRGTQMALHRNITAKHRQTQKAAFLGISHLHTGSAVEQKMTRKVVCII
jgi:hypothetical protein